MNSNLYHDDEPTNEEYNKLVVFLRNLATSIENKALVPQQLQVISEFFMSYQFHEQSIKDNQILNNMNEFSQEDMLKFLCMGWYIYRCILNNNSL
jgi:hypothetical protein